MMVLLTRGLTRPAERILEDDAVVDFCGVEPSPAAHVMVFSTGFLALKGQQFLPAVAHPVIVRFSDAHRGFVRESNQALVGDSESELAVEYALA